jgi:hypothetical protein
MLAARHLLHWVRVLRTQTGSATLSTSVSIYLGWLRCICFTGPFPVPRTQAGGVALNLTEASRVFLCDPWWNPAVEDQAMDRIHRCALIG